MTTKKQYALVLGASSGFGESICKELASKGINIYGVHMDMGAGKKKAEEIRDAVSAMGVDVKFFNTNAADDKKRADVIASIKEDLEAKGAELKVLVHSLAFGSMTYFFSEDHDKMITRKQIEMTLDVMANSIVYWTQDLFKEKLLVENFRIFALTSIGSTRVMENYGAVSAAKCALESYIRQFAVELAPYKVTANALLAGVTDTPAARKIPGFETMIDRAKELNPFVRNTHTIDIAKAISMLISEDSYWITGQTIYVDGGEGIINIFG
jgi:enoyl-[acyl-carrier-protein] reductase (NADH)